MKKIISFSLWGNDYKYLGGALQNIELAKFYYPEWICRFYVGVSTNKKFVEKLMSFDNVEVVSMDEHGDWTGMLWRFYPASDSEVDIMVSRDCDSRIHPREVYAVNEWINSDKKFHIMRDHQYHGIPILGGMWGSKKGVIHNIKELCDEFQLEEVKGIDQKFLAEKIFPIVKNSSLVHDEIHRIEVDSTKYPSSSGVRNPDHFVGQAYNGDGKVLDKDVSFLDFLVSINGPKINIYDESTLFT